MTQVKKPSDDDARLVCLGAITGAHGVRGWVKVQSFTARATDLAAYGVLCDSAGNPRFTICEIAGGKTSAKTSPKSAKAILRVRLRGIEGRDAAAALKGERLYVRRDALPALPDSVIPDFYYADLIGLAVRANMRANGDKPQNLKVLAVHNFGAGDILEIGMSDIKDSGIFMPFTNAHVPEVNIAQGYVVINLPEDTEEPEHDQDK